jgi:hypothetical protein
MLHFWMKMFEKLLLALLLVASLAGFWWRFGAVLRKVRAAKPDNAPGQSHP